MPNPTQRNPHEKDPLRAGCHSRTLEVSDEGEPLPPAERSEVGGGRKGWGMEGWGLAQIRAKRKRTAGPAHSHALAARSRSPLCPGPALPLKPQTSPKPQSPFLRLSAAKRAGGGRGGDSRKSEARSHTLAHPSNRNRRINTTTPAKLPTKNTTIHIPNPPMSSGRGVGTCAE